MGWSNEVDKTSTDTDSAGPEKVDVTSTLRTSSGISSEVALGPDSHIFEDPKIAEHYVLKYEQAKYEGRHLFDPSMQWGKLEEKRVLRKTDLHAVLFAFILFFALDVDRYNLSNAVSGTFMEDLGLTTNDYNLGNTINTVCFLLAEFPSQLLSKKIGPNRWIPIQIVSWSLAATLQCQLKNKAGFLATRAILGFLEGGFIPCMCLWLSYFYSGRELSTRIGYFYLANPITSAVSSFLAWAIFHLKGKNGWKSWQYIFFIEGLLTMFIGIVSWFQMPSSISQTKTKWRPRGWYTDREEKIMVNRLLRDDPQKGDTGNRKGLSVRDIFDGIADWRMWPMFWSRLLIDIVAHPIKTYLPILLKSMGFSTVNINLLMIPYNFGTIITMQTQTHLSQAFGQTAYALVCSPIWLLPCVVAMKFWPGFIDNQWGTYALLTVCMAYPPSWPLSVSWVSANANSVKQRTVSLPLVNIHGQLASIIGNNIFRMDDAPRYERGLAYLVGVAIAAIGVVLGARVFYSYLNKMKKAIWSKMTYEEQQEYINTTTDSSSKRLDFYFKL